MEQSDVRVQSQISEAGGVCFQAQMHHFILKGGCLISFLDFLWVHLQ